MAVGKVIDTRVGRRFRKNIRHISGHDHTLSRLPPADVYIVSTFDPTDHRPQVARRIRSRDERKAKDSEGYFVLFAPGQCQVFRLELTPTIGVICFQRVILTNTDPFSQSVHGDGTYQYN